MKNILVLLFGFLLVAPVQAQEYPPPERAQTELSIVNSILSGAITSEQHVVSYYTPVVVNTGNMTIANISYVNEPMHSPSKVPRYESGNIILNSVKSNFIAITTAAKVPFHYQRGKATYYR